MREITVTFDLTDELEERLKKITQEYQKQHNLQLSEDRMFGSIMLVGSFHDIDEKMKFHEWKLGLRDSFYEKNVQSEGGNEIV